jgi:hypothetical protein
MVEIKTKTKVKLPCKVSNGVSSVIIISPRNYQTLEGINSLI